MNKPKNILSEKIKNTPDPLSDVAVIGDPLKSNSKWSAVQRVRLPHKVGLPLGSGGCGDSIER
jgi:hypothetical protein